MVVAENLENSRRFKIGREAGRFDRGAEVPSDMPHFEETGFDKEDEAYVAGYELGYREGPQEKKKKNKGDDRHGL